MHTFVLLLSLVSIAAVAAVFITVARTASQPADGPPAAPSRSATFWGVITLGVAVTVATTLDLPYGVAASATGAEQRVAITGHQWYWDISHNTVTAGQPVVFEVDAADVNHGMGIYDPDGVLIGQTQAMPGYTNRLQMQFDQPGTYKLACMEFCGTAHHAMVAQLTVTEGTP